ncbi:hypothetical protein BKA66DRAFT_547961 [Pyrenochaeta sp. MPI-SDFR-AT-0127]|nr:hypothetical protein BKA66DRAFT_547961 [Pyrenochaeta sp. MPI-SDFR-AT-0127]
MSFAPPSKRLSNTGKVTYSALAQEQEDNNKRGNLDDKPVATGWPAKPQVLQGFSTLTFIGDCVLVALPISFLVLAIAAYRLDQKPISEYGKMVQSAMMLGPTIYPLLFAALGGRSLRGIAVWRVECGTTIEVLEKLIALSPLGGQSTLRLLRETNSTALSPSTVYYAAPEAPFVLQHASSWYSVVPTILTASLAASGTIKNGTVDLWNHHKVPRLRAVESAKVSSTDENQHWVPVNNDTKLDYSSWTGVNAQGLEPGKHSEFRVKYNYLAVDCTLSVRDKPIAVLDHLRQPSTYIYSKFPSKNSTTSQETNSAYTKNETQNTFRFLYGTGSFNTGMFHVYECKPEIITVEADIGCQSDSCEVEQIRRIPNRHGFRKAHNCNVDIDNSLACLQRTTMTLNVFISFLPTLTSPYASPYTPMGQRLNFSDPFDDFIFAGSGSYGNDSPRENRDWDTVPTELISQRLTILLNTYWQAASWGGLITRGKPFAVPEIPIDQPSSERFDQMNATEAEKIIQTPVYSANIPWIGTLLFTTTILLLLGDLHLFVSVVTTAPGLFSYAASLTRENPFVSVPNGGSALRGTERVRFLRKLKVQVADVKPDDEVGYVALKSVDNDAGFEEGLIVRGRMYS